MSSFAAPKVPTRPDPVGALSAAQTKAALALAYGGTVSASADSIGVHRSSIHNWFNNDPNFKQAVEEIRRDRNERLSDQMRELESLAILNRPKEPSGREEWSVPRMESLGTTLDRKSFVADTPRQISTLFADSDVANRPLANGFGGSYGVLTAWTRARM